MFLQYSPNATINIFRNVPECILFPVMKKLLNLVGMNFGQDWGLGHSMLVFLILSKTMELSRCVPYDALVKQPLSMMLPPPCLTAGTVFLEMKSLSLIYQWHTAVQSLSGLTIRGYLAWPCGQLERIPSWTGLCYCCSQLVFEHPTSFPFIRGQSLGQMIGTLKQLDVPAWQWSKTHMKTGSCKSCHISTQ